MINTYITLYFLAFILCIFKEKLHFTQYLLAKARNNLDLVFVKVIKRVNMHPTVLFIIGKLDQIELLFVYYITLIGSKAHL